MPKTRILLEIGAACRRIRRAHDLTLADVAERYGCHPSLIAKFERGENNNLTYFIFAYFCAFSVDRFKIWRCSKYGG